MLLSIIIPAFNEEKTISEVLEKISMLKITDHNNLEIEKEIIVVNDCSGDKTEEIVTALSKKYPIIKLLTNQENMGKSQSVKRGILDSTGDWVVIQDADLEYDPEDFVFILQQVLKNNCDVGYGNRFGIDNGIGYIANFWGNIFVSACSSIFTSARLHVYIPDMEVCYKLIRGAVAREIGKDLVSRSNFGFEPEITARLSRYKKADNVHLKFIVLPIKYYPRTFAEGKKMHAVKDGIKAIIEIIKFNLF